MSGSQHNAPIPVNTRSNACRPRRSAASYTLACTKSTLAPASAAIRRACASDAPEKSGPVIRAPSLESDIVSVPMWHCRWTHGRHLTEELRQYAAAGASRPTPAVHQVKLSLKYVRSPVWRRVQVPSDFPLGGLHLVIQAAMGWDGDHLHQFTVNRRHFSDPGYDLDAQDEWRARLAGVLPRPGLSASYLYDFGDSWEHTIKVEKVGEAEAGATYPRCTAGKGTRPGEDGGEPEPFDMERINRRLASILTAS